jgi:transaldolase
MVEEARRIAAIHEHVVVKCPLTRDGLKATRALSDDGIRVNVTLCFSPTQALLAAKAGAAYISPFVGRLDDISYDGMALIQQIMAIYENYGFGTEVLVASVRHPKHIVDAALMGADVATIPFKAFDAMFNHPLTDKGLAAFLADWEKAREVVAPEAVKA